MAKQKKKDNKLSKIFVLDTNVLLHDPQCLHKFEDNIIAIPVEVLEELDKKKSAPGELGFSARKIHRDLRLLFDNNLEDEAKLKEAFRSALSCTLQTGGQLIVVINDFLINTKESESLNRLRATLFDLDKMDSRILASVFFLKEICDDQRVILVTKDANMALKGISLGLEVQDYMNDKISNKQMSSGLNEITLSKENFDLFIEEHGVDLPPEDTKDLYINEYVYLRHESNLEIARYHGDGQLEALIIGDSMGIKIPKGIRIQPLNLEQRMLMDAMLDEDIKLITCRG